MKQSEKSILLISSISAPAKLYYVAFLVIFVLPEKDFKFPVRTAHDNESFFSILANDSRRSLINSEFNEFKALGRLSSIRATLSWIVKIKFFCVDVNRRFVITEVICDPWEMVATLLKDLSQNQSVNNLTPYNDEGVRLSIDEFKILYQEYMNSRNIYLLDQNNVSCKAKTFILETQLKRYKRILLAYHIDRLMKLSRRMISSTDFSQNSLNNLSKCETKFYHLQADSIVKYKSGLGHLVNIFGPIVPPKDFYIQVRVEQDCGIIQTEYGRVTLNRGTMHFLKRNDIEHLIVRGLLTHII